MVSSSYRINDGIIFDKNTFELTSLTDVNEVITLHAPTARCLLLLIEKKGEVVSRECFLEQVWHARGVVVSENTFYQNISLLRKSLKKVAPKENIVITVRSRGFIIPENTRIQPLEDKKEMEETHFTNETGREEKEASLSLLPVISNASGEKATDPPFLSLQSKAHRGLKWLLIVFIILEFTSLMFTFLKG